MNTPTPQDNTELYTILWDTNNATGVNSDDQALVGQYSNYPSHYGVGDVLHEQRQTLDNLLQEQENV